MILPFSSILLFLSLLLSLNLSAQPLPGQIRMDPRNGSYMVYNRDQNRDGQLDPFFAIGPGEPEEFFYLGERRADGTRTDTRQQEILRRVQQQGGNALYIQVVRSHGGDGEPDHNPWNNFADPASGINPAIIRQWKGWLTQMQQAGIVLFLFVYDDGTHPFDDGGCRVAGAVSEPERAFVRQLVNELKGFSNLVWVVQEEFRFIKEKPKDANREPCTEARTNRVRNLANLIKESDEHAHPVGIHHNIGLPMQFAERQGGNQAVNLYVQQSDVRKTAGRPGPMNLDTLHAQGVSGFDPQHRYGYVMAECYDWHRKLLEAKDRPMLRKSYYASAMAGGGVLVLAMFDGKTPDPTDEMLGDMRRMQQFFEAIPFNTLAPADRLRHGGTRWVLANAETGQYVLYATDKSPNLGVKSLPKSRYTLTWFDPETGVKKEQQNVDASGDATFAKPGGLGQEVLLFVRRVR